MKYLLPLSAIVAAMVAGPAMAASDLPGGASSLQEVYGSWQVVCNAPPQPEKTSEDTAGKKDAKAPAAAKSSCVLAQVQLEQASRRLIVSVEIRLDDPKLPGKPSATIVMPFGFAVTRPVSIMADGKSVQDMQVATCLPVGCIVPFEPNPGLLEALNGGKAISLSAEDVEGRPVTFPLQSNGFADGLKRLQALNS